MKTDLKQLSGEDLILLMEGLGQRPFRTNQVTDWIYKRLATSIDEMTDLSKDLREELKKKSFISSLKPVRRQTSEDGTQKFLFQMEDGETVESVLIPNSKGEGRFTLCISSQVGCAMGCTFCMTGSLGLKRNLKAKEIFDQVITVKRHLQQKIISGPSPLLPIPGQRRPDTDSAPGITNIVFMGMGEPFNNFQGVHSALIKLTGFMGFSKRAITVSTSGIIPGIRKFAESPPLVNLAVSLNATTEETRSRIMPINKKYSLRQLLRACREFPLPPNRRITFEYILLGKINDAAEDAHRLVRLLKGIKSMVNLIPYNPSPHYPELKQPSAENILLFQSILKKSGMTVMARKSMGADIAAACGQLKAAYR